MFHAGDQLVPGYRLEKFLGRGQFGEVWRASSPGGTQCALKILNLSGSQGWKEYRAIQLFKRIRHPHLAPINAIWLLDAEGRILEDDVAAGMALDNPGERSTLIPDPELQPQPATLIVATTLAERTLGDRLREYQAQGQSGIPLQELLQYMDEAAKGLDFLNTVQHDLGVGRGSMQHCDIKPENILLIGGSAMICDFGVSHVLSGDQNAATATSMVGSPAYMSPECAERKPSSASDQYSLALTYYELRTGELPFEDLNCLSILQAHRSGKLKLAALPPGERAVIRRSTAVRPEERYTTAAEMVQTLRSAAELRPVAGQGGRARAVAGGTLAVAVAGLLLWLAFGRGDAPVLPLDGSSSVATSHSARPREAGSESGQDEPPTAAEDPRQADGYARAALVMVREVDLDAARLSAAVAEYKRAVAAAPDGPYTTVPQPEFVLRPPAGPQPAATDEALRCMLATADRQFIVAAGDSGVVWAWRLDDPAALPEKLAVHRGPVWSLAAGGQVIASADLQGQINVSRLETAGVGEAIALQADGGLAALTVSRDGRWLACGGEEGQVLLWDLAAGDPQSSRQELGRHEEAVTALQFVDQDRGLVTVSYDDTARKWPLPPPAGPGVELARLTGDVNCLAVDPRQGAIAFAGEGGLAALTGSVQAEHRISLLRAADDAATALPLGHADVIEALVWDDSGQALASGAIDGTIQVWSLAEPSVSGPAFLHGHAGPVRGLAFCPLPGWLVSGGADKTAGLWRWQDGQQTPTPLRLGGHQGRVLAVAVTANWIITACEDGALRLWNLAHCLLVKQACDELGLAPRAPTAAPLIKT